MDLYTGTNAFPTDKTQEFRMQFYLWKNVTDIDGIFLFTYNLAAQICLVRVS